MQYFKSNTAMIIELHFFMKEIKDLCLPVCVIFSSIFCMQLLFHMFSTFMSLEDRLRLKLKVQTEVSLPMAIPIYHTV